MTFEINLAGRRKEYEIVFACWYGMVFCVLVVVVGGCRDVAAKSSLCDMLWSRKDVVEMKVHRKIRNTGIKMNSHETLPLIVKSKLGCNCTRGMVWYH